MISTKDPVFIETKHLHFNNLNHVALMDNDLAIFNAYLEFIFHHTINDRDTYEAVLSQLKIADCKSFFLQLACRKQEVIAALKMHRSSSSAMLNSGRNQNGETLVKYIPETELTSLNTLSNALQFAQTKENRTNALYDKMSKTANLTSVKILFNYVLSSQKSIGSYISKQFKNTMSVYS